MQTIRIETYENAKQVMNNALATAMHATWCAVNHTLKNIPDEIVFARYMFVNIPVIADLIAIRQRHQLLIDKNLMHHSHHRERYDYKYRIGKKVMVKAYDPKKGKERLHGPYLITKLNTN